MVLKGMMKKAKKRPRERRQHENNGINENDQQVLDTQSGPRSSSLQMERDGVERDRLEERHRSLPNALTQGQFTGLSWCGPRQTAYRNCFGAETRQLPAPRHRTSEGVPQPRANLEHDEREQPARWDSCATELELQEGGFLADFEFLGEGSLGIIEGTGEGMVQPLAQLEQPLDHAPDDREQTHGWDPRVTEIGPEEEGLLTVCNHLGQGSLGHVDEVKLIGQSHPTIVRKRIKLPHQKRGERLQKIIREEAATVAALTHPHIVRIIGTYEDRTQSKMTFSCLLMTPVGDRDLEAFLDLLGARELGPEGFVWPWKWFGCLASALAYMHGQGVRHQDIKPSNIIHKRDEIYFTDFGSSSRFHVGHTTSADSLTRTSPMYGAPEVVDYLQENGDLNRHGLGSDIFSLGCVFAEMLAVLNGSPADAFHQFLLRTSSNRPDPPDEHSSLGSSSGLLYSRALPRVDDWFRAGSNIDFYGYCIRPMLSPSRHSRPGAEEVLRNLTTVQSPDIKCRCRSSAASE